MKNKINLINTIAIIFLLAWGSVYLMISFIVLEINCFEWDETTRLAYVALSFFANMLGIFSYFSILEETNDT